MPRAEDFCNVVIEDNPVPTPTNPLCPLRQVMVKPTISCLMQKQRYERATGSAYMKARNRETAPRMSRALFPLK